MNVILGNDECVDVSNANGDGTYTHLGLVGENSAIFPTTDGWIRVDNIGQGEMSVTVCAYIDGKKGTERTLQLKEA